MDKYTKEEISRAISDTATELGYLSLKRLQEVVISIDTIFPLLLSFLPPLQESCHSHNYWPDCVTSRCSTCTYSSVVVEQSYCSELKEREPEGSEFVEVDAEHLGRMVVDPVHTQHHMSKLDGVSCTIRDVNLD